MAQRDFARLWLTLWSWFVPLLGLVYGCVEPRFAERPELDGEADLKLPDGSGPEGGADAELDGQSDADAQLEDPDATRADVSWPDTPCSDDRQVLGAECPGVVWCTDSQTCDLRTNVCCVTQLESQCIAQTECAPSKQRFYCDGPEDCLPGEVCCQSSGSLRCARPEECPEVERACHTDADCQARRCVEGYPGMVGPFPVTYFLGGGICRGP